jgi:hypothetical protein
MNFEVQAETTQRVGDRMRQEVYRIRIELDRAVRVPVTVHLESSDPGALDVPASITVRPGQTTAILDVLPTVSLRQARSVTVRTVHADPAFTSREATVTVRPRSR